MKMQDFGMVMLIAIVVIMAFMGFGLDLASKYDFQVSDTLQTEANSTIDRLDDASESITEAISSEQGWLETAFTLLFKSNVILDSLFGIMGTTTTFFGVIVGEAGVQIPVWFMPVLTIAIVLTIVFIIAGIVLKRGGGV